MLAIIQARTSSRRLPNKVINDFVNKPMILWTCERLLRCGNISNIVVATSDDPSDDALCKLLISNDIPFFRGDLHNVADRYLALINKYQCDSFVRISGDSPLIDPELVDKVIEKFKENDADITCNIFPRSFPKGQSVEVINAGAFKKAVSKFQTADHLEHVTSYFYENHSHYNIINLSNSEQMNHIQLSIDTESDHERLEALVGKIGADNLSLSKMIAGYNEV